MEPPFPQADDVSGLLTGADSFAGSVYLDVDTTVYPRTVLFRTCYIYTDRCYLFLRPIGSSVIRVHIRPRPDQVSDDIVGDFCNELIEQEIRFTLASESRDVRDLIVTQAFAEAEFHDGRAIGSSR